MAEKVLITKSKISGIADAIRTKTGSTATMTLDSMATNIANIPSGGETDTKFITLAERTIASIEDDSLTTIGEKAFTKCPLLKVASFKIVETVGAYAFDYCNVLTTITLNSATDIGNYAFNNCKKLTLAIIPKTKTIGNYAFTNCSSLKSISLPSVTSIGSYAFKSCSGLAQIKIMSDSVATITTTTFTSTPIASGSGTILVPESLVDAYKTDSIWSMYASQIQGY